jgi:hypothetical protein
VQGRNSSACCFAEGYGSQFSLSVHAESDCGDPNYQSYPTKTELCSREDSYKIVRSNDTAGALNRHTVISHLPRHPCMESKIHAQTEAESGVGNSEIPIRLAKLRPITIRSSYYDKSSTSLAL